MQSVAEYFGLAHSHDLAWCHGVHTAGALARVAEDPAVHVAVAGVRFGAADAVPMAAATLQGGAELEILTLLATLASAGKAIKLDMLEPAAVEPTLAVLQRLRPDVPVILHANVFALLPHAQREEGLPPEAFFKLCQQYTPRAVISLGWSLKRSHDADGRLEEGLIEQMADMTRHHLPAASYGIEIRAGYTSGVERGAALIFDPLPEPPHAGGRYGDNVVDASARFTRSVSAA